MLSDIGVSISCTYTQPAPFLFRGWLKSLFCSLACTQAAGYKCDTRPIGSCRLFNQHWWIFDGVAPGERWPAVSSLSESVCTEEDIQYLAVGARACLSDTEYPHVPPMKGWHLFHLRTEIGEVAERIFFFALCFPALILSIYETSCMCFKVDSHVLKHAWGWRSCRPGCGFNVLVENRSLFQKENP